MNDELFARIRGLSLEIQSLIKQGVKEGVEERIHERNELLQQWFSGISDLIQLTNDQQLFLEELLKAEQQLVADLKLEQAGLFRQQTNRKKASLYQQH
ncbi:hypothetical protein ACQUQU_11520 [Thalassolituus sp. LLYu03]|uniref:hypothetical protein n=1 Tax=Thalassolituus sp. LLYu03 TaxID=3421656 RepID=UPI003D2E76E8